MRQIPPMIMKDSYWRMIERGIMVSLNELIYRPLIEALKDPHPEYMNDASALLRAVRAGTIWYEEGHFYGEFNAATSRELRMMGAMFNQKSRTWSLANESLPTDVRLAQHHADSRYDALRRALVQTLDNVDIESIDKTDHAKIGYHQTINWMNDDFTKSVKNISIPATMTPTQKDMIAAEWGTNLNKYIKDWSAKNILSLREDIQQHTLDGRRAESYAKIIQQNYGVSQRKAEFLARQETSNLMAKFRESRYGEIGVRKYRWSTSHDERVRSDHKHLNGKVFSFDSPPVSNLKTGARNNPGEDFGCRCVAIGLVE